MNTLTNDQTKFFLGCREAIIEKGEDYIYSRREPTVESPYACVYVRDGKPSCIVGQGLIRSGLLSLSTVSEHEGDVAHVVLPWPADDVSNIINDMQEYQDNGETWGYAYDKALNSLAYDGYDVSDLLLFHDGYDVSDLLP